MANFTATNTPIEQKNPGNVVQLQSAIAAADQADVGNWHVQLRIYRVSDNAVIANFQILNQALSLTPLVLTRNFTLAANLPLGQYKAQASVHTPGASWAWQTTTQTPAFFDVVAVAAAPPPAPASLVKVSGDEQGGTINQTQSAPMVVQALNADLQPFPGATVTWSTDAGTLSEASTVTGGPSDYLLHRRAPGRAGPMSMGISGHRPHHSRRTCVGDSQSRHRRRLADQRLDRPAFTERSRVQDRLRPRLPAL